MMKDVFLLRIIFHLHWPSVVALLVLGHLYFTIEIDPLKGPHEALEAYDESTYSVLCLLIKTQKVMEEKLMRLARM